MAGATLLLTACGQRGPLYLPAKPAPAIAATPAKAQPASNDAAPAAPSNSAK
jgi:predicted small lipoprotein YifL